CGASDDTDTSTGCTRSLHDALPIFSQTKLVELLRNVGTGVLQWNRVAVLINRTQWLVNFDEGTVRQLLDDTGFDTVLQDLAVGTLQANTDCVRNPVSNRRKNCQTDTANPGHRVQRDVEEVRNVVVTTGHGYQQDERNSSE